MHDVSRFWELEQDKGQIQDVQGRLKGILAFWKDVLEASGPVVECIKGVVTNTFSLITASILQTKP